jgi:hypothetical protein
MRFPGGFEAIDGGSRQSSGEGTVDEQDDRALVFYDFVTFHFLVREPNARLTSDYATWPYRHLLDARVADATRNVEVFRRADARAGGPTIMVRSRYACMGCHQQ